MRTAAIVNPHSDGGHTGRRWPRISAALAGRLGPVHARFTAKPGHATALARELLEQGFERIIAVGGDGTVSETANGFLEADRPVRPGASLGILPLGTGRDFQRTLGIARDMEAAIEELANGIPLPIDVGKAVFTDSQGSSRTRYFINLLSFGMGGEVASRSRNWLGLLGGRAAFLYASAVSVFSYRPQDVRLHLDGSAEEQSFTIYNVAVGNGRFHGGGMQACPTAVLNDGMLDITVIESMPLVRLLADFHVLYSDNVYRHPKVHHLRAQSIRADSARPEHRPIRVEIDGEPLGALPLEISVLPACLPVLVAPSSPLLRAGNW